MQQAFKYICVCVCVRARARVCMRLSGERSWVGSANTVLVVSSMDGHV